jgi:TetR/AcrR family transcriptional regulator
MYKKLDDDTINTILETGIDEFANNGLDRANINVIAKKAGVSVGVIYKYYKDKDSFFLTCVRHSLKLLEQVLKDAFSDGTDVMTCIRRIVNALLEHSRKHKNYNVMYNEITSGSCKNRKSNVFYQAIFSLSHTHKPLMILLNPLNRCNFP